MSEYKSILAAEGGANQIAVDRAISELRSGRPAIIRSGRNHIIVTCVETLESRMAIKLEALARGRARLILPGPRLRRLGLERTEPGHFALPKVNLDRIATLALEVGARFDAPVAALSSIDKAALELLRLSLVLPAAIIVPVTARAAAESGLIVAESSAVFEYRGRKVVELRIVGRAPVPLEGAPETEFVVFRGGEGLRDQVAILISKPDLNKPINVRLHSACLTGDLFGSLKCDCGDQLRDTAKFMAQNGGGVLLYLDQEGRGNGLSNKMRAYKLQAQGFDTYDADEVLGFDHDQRGFDFAAEMLKQLGVHAVRVMTNNPVKIAALRAAGLDIVSDQRVLGRMNDHNVRYLASKRDRAGHIIDVDQLTAYGAVKE
ncbi:MAG: GTP cyclohydrolase II RibA [Beijerinckiaceae bacterium]|nr:GTP cyclohydrolase II RibA [Beijerinckiaceae bacterium]